jgi:HEAT repeat protein
MALSDSRPVGARVVLILVPVLTFAVFAVMTAMGIGMLAFLSAMGHGSLTSEEARPWWWFGAALSLTAAAVVTLVLERTVVGPRGSRSAEIKSLTWQTRSVAATLIVALTIGGPPAAAWWADWRAQNRALSRRNPERYSAIVALELRPSPEARQTLLTIARDTSDDSGMRAAAIGALHPYPDVRDVLLSLAADPAPEVRAAAGRALLRSADDPRVWAVIEQLARDNSLAAREQMAAALAEAPVPAAAEESRRALLREIARSDTPVAALGAAAALGAEGYDAALAMLNDRSLFDERRLEALKLLGRLKDARVADLLRDILNDDTAEGFIAAGSADSYRDAAANALVAIFGEDGDDMAAAYFNERQTRIELDRVVQAQTKYKAATGFFDARLACLELPATCAPGRNVDESFLGPALASDAPRHGYRRTLIAGPPPPASEIAARRASPTSTTAFAYVLAPLVPGRTGLRAYCADDTGMVCVGVGKVPDVRGGRCQCQ